MTADEMAAVFARGNAAWPELVLLESQLRAFLEARPHADAAQAADLYLACGCGLGLEEALRAFEATYGPVVRRAASRLGDPSLLDAAELTQRVHERLFLPRGAGKILEYGGKAPLSAWLRVVIARVVLNATQSARATELDGSPPELDPVTYDDPEILLLRRRYQAELKEALATALGSLEPAHRNVLRYSVVDGLTTEQIARLSGVHRATAVRWLAAARAQVRGAVRRSLAAKLGATESELHSLARLIRSDLNLSLKRLLP